ncbi:MAG: preprotein translocase subunit SecG [Acidobacteria bacterium]|nr:MAG: preprotein translocase subunit SecG [Acidobacteriota bacterium]
MLVIFITIMHVFVSVFLILIVLTQQGKGQDLASAFGGSGSQTAFGARGTATLLSKITAGAAALFMITSLSLSYLRPAVTGESVIQDIPAPSQPATDPSGATPEAGVGADDAEAGESEDPPAEGESPDPQ